MGLGLTLLGLAVAALITTGGQIWLTHQELQDALNNAIIVMESAHQRSTQELAGLIAQDAPSLATVTVTSLTTSGNGEIVASVSTPVNLWFWAVWMGAKPIAVTATV